MVKFEKMMLVDDCDFIKPIVDFTSIGDKWYDWFIGTEKVRNRTGDWFFGVVALKDPNLPSVLNGSCEGLTKNDLLSNFSISRYDLRIFTGGCYYFNSKTEEWEGVGVSVSDLEKECHEMLYETFRCYPRVAYPHTVKQTI